MTSLAGALQKTFKEDPKGDLFVALVRQRNGAERFWNKTAVCLTVLGKDGSGNITQVCIPFYHRDYQGDPRFPGRAATSGGRLKEMTPHQGEAPHDFIVRALKEVLQAKRLDSLLTSFPWRDRKVSISVNKDCAHLLQEGIQGDKEQFAALDIAVVLEEGEFRQVVDIAQQVLRENPEENKTIDRLIVFRIDALAHAYIEQGVLPYKNTCKTAKTSEDLLKDTKKIYDGTISVENLEILAFVIRSIARALGEELFTRVLDPKTAALIERINRSDLKGHELDLALQQSLQKFREVEEKKE